MHQSFTCDSDNKPAEQDQTEDITAESQVLLKQHNSLESVLLGKRRRSENDTKQQDLPNLCLTKRAKTDGESWQNLTRTQHNLLDLD